MLVYYSLRIQIIENHDACIKNVGGILGAQTNRSHDNKYDGRTCLPPYRTKTGFENHTRRPEIAALPLRGQTSNSNQKRQTPHFVICMANIKHRSIFMLTSNVFKKGLAQPNTEV